MNNDDYKYVEIEKNISKKEQNNTFYSSYFYFHNNYVFWF